MAGLVSIERPPRRAASKRAIVIDSSSDEEDAIKSKPMFGKRKVVADEDGDLPPHKPGDGVKAISLKGSSSSETALPISSQKQRMVCVEIPVWLQEASPDDVSRTVKSTSTKEKQPFSVQNVLSNHSNRKRKKVESDSDEDFKLESDEAMLLQASEDMELMMDIANSGTGSREASVPSAVDSSEDEGSVMEVDEKPKWKRKAAPKKVAIGGISAAARKKGLAAAADAGNLPPMSDLSEMFKDMITRTPVSPEADNHQADSDLDSDLGGMKKSGQKMKQAKLNFGGGGKGKGKVVDEGILGEFPKPKGEYLAKLTRRLGGRKLRVATMCSGTESPLLALGMISRQMKIAYGAPFEVEHVFSAEIEPYKQAYIERNFAPPILFRDVTELGGNQATTAYGALVEVPGNVDLLVAGTSCVDYSNLNNQKKDIEAKGESGNTFRGMLSWVTKHRPRIVILENVCSAPWGKVAEHFEKIGYSAAPTKFDTKDFYIPHTRTRGYLVAFRNPPEKEGGQRATADLPAKWVEMVKSMERPASSPLEAFLLPPNDPRLHQGRLELAAAKGMGKSRMPTDWGRCASRHEKCRFEEGLGTKRPWTDWRDGAICNFPEGYWNDWANAQTERVQDLTDVSHLRAARLGTDAAYRTLVWNLSQNVDREIGSGRRPGIVPCMTPSMIPYVTNRGGPLIGIEALALQGIPADELLLTRETEDQLADLAGNAMSSTVVGVCILSALILATNLFDGEGTPEPSDDGVSPAVSIVDAALSAVGRRIEAHIIGQQRLLEKPLNLAISQRISTPDLLKQAACSARYCLCEGPTGTSSAATLLCTACGHTRCEDCSPKPLHVFQPHPLSGRRTNPRAFSKQLKSVLPMRLAISGFSCESLEREKNRATSASISPDDWRIWKEAVIDGLDDVEFHFRNLDRKHHWIAIYESPKAFLRLSLYESKAVWLLFVKAPCSDNANARRRAILRQPVARMEVRIEAHDLLNGAWSLYLPARRDLKVSIKGTGTRIPAWEARIGLVDLPQTDASGKSVDREHWQDKKQWDRLDVKVESSGSNGLDLDLDGLYELHPGCGTAMECLHIRKAMPGKPQISLFLDPVRVGFARDDSFVFALDHERLDFEVDRVTLATLDPAWRPNDTEGPEQLGGEVRGYWTSMDGVDLHSVEDSMESVANATASYASPEGPLDLKLDDESCNSAVAVMLCRVPLPHADAEQLWTSVRDVWGEIELQHKGKQAFDTLAWITERLPKMKTLEEWTTVTAGALLEDCESCCQRCAPVQPELNWMLKQNRLVPVEDVVQAGEYERAMKRRPAPIVAQLRLDGGVGSLQLGLNVATLLHRALSRLPSVGRDQSPTLTWRLRTDYAGLETAFFKPSKLVLSSNREDVSAAQPPNFRKYHLRPEQLRSLTWMLERERPATTHTFIEEEIDEATLPALGWRAEGRASRPVMIRGGVLADEVGYGKTAITLALIDVARELPASNVKPSQGRIPTKATLVVVPAHLTRQWEGEISKFLGQGTHDYKVIKLLDLTSVNALTIEDVLTADIIIVALSIFKSPLFWSNLAGFASSGTLPAGDLATRHFTARLEEVLEGLRQQVRLLAENGFGPQAVATKIQDALDQTLSERKRAKETRNTFALAFGKKRLTGAAYLAMQEEDAKAGHTAKKAKLDMKSEREANDPWRLKSKAIRQDWHKMQSPPLHMFHFRRVVIDEFTYVDQKSHSAVTSFAAESIWVLSGTPPISDFAAVKGIAELLHIHLGVDDDTEGASDAVKRRRKGQTAVEAFHSFRETHTASWHEARYGVAQRFLDAFVRQNVAEIDEIPCSEHVVSITLPAAEHAIYLELDHHINSLQGINKKIMKSAKGARADRQTRMSDALGTSDDPREALIKRCAHFEMEADADLHNAGEACERIVKTRTEQRELCEEDLHYTLAEAVALYLVIQSKKGYSDLKLGAQERKTSHLVEYLKGTFGPAGNGDHDATQLHRNVIRSEGIVWIEKDADIKVDENIHKVQVKSRPKRGDDDSSTIDLKAKVDELKWQLREKSHVLRKLATELVSRTRSLRYFTAVRDVQKRGDAALSICGKCKGSTGSEMCILSACGHTGCLDCLTPLATHGYECPEDGCRINLELHQVIPASTLGREEKSGRFGAKLLQLVAIIKAIPADERVLVFVQFDDLLAKIRAALKAARVGTIVIKGTATQQANELDRFQKLDVQDPKAERVLILNVAAASASGANLTLANHVIFVHPVHYPEHSNDRFIATETQAIGRIRRYGQKRPCHVYRLLTRNSVDEAIMEERTGRKPVGNYVVSTGLDEVIDLGLDDDEDVDMEVPKPKKRAAAGKKCALAERLDSDAEEEAIESDGMDSEEVKPKGGRGRPARVTKKRRAVAIESDEEDAVESIYESE